MTPNRRLIAQYADVYRPIIDTRPLVCAHTQRERARARARSQQPNVTPNLRRPMRMCLMRIRKREGRIALSRISTGCHRMLDDISMEEDRA